MNRTRSVVEPQAPTEGLNESATHGVLAGYPVVGVKVTLHSGSHSELDSNRLAFKVAASLGFKEGCRKADPVILEPVMAVEVWTPEDYLGDVMGDLNRRRGTVLGIGDQVGGAKTVQASVPLAKLFNYTLSLRSMTQGRATCTMEFDAYQEAPRSVAEAISAERKK